MSDPKKSKKKSVKGPTQSKLSKETNIPIPSAEKINIDQMFLQALARHKNELLADKKAKLKEISHLSLIAEEYMSAFAVIGYSLQNEQVVIFNAHTPKDEAALVDLLRATFLDIANNRP